MFVFRPIGGWQLTARQIGSGDYFRVADYHAEPRFPFPHIRSLNTLLSDDMKLLTGGILSVSVSQTDPAFWICGFGRPVS
jgi:hypothetical protein